MTTIYIESVCDDDVGEVEGAFDENGNVLDIWSSNDAQWRHEYFNDTFQKLGINIEHGKYEDKLVDAAAEHWGITR
jgi:hypothetical protein